MAYLIAQCVNVDPEHRPPYDALVTDLSRLASNEVVTMPDTAAKIRMLEFETRNRELREQEIERGALLVLRIREDLSFVAARLSTVYQGTDLVLKIGALTARNADPKQVMKEAIERNYVPDLFVWHFPMGKAIALVHRPNPSGSLPFRERFISIILETYGRGQTELHIGECDGVLVLINLANAASSAQYSRERLISEFLAFFQNMLETSDPPSLV